MAFQHQVSDNASPSPMRSIPVVGSDIRGGGKKKAALMVEWDNFPLESATEAQRWAQSYRGILAGRRAADSGENETETVAATRSHVPALIQTLPPPDFEPHQQTDITERRGYEPSRYEHSLGRPDANIPTNPGNNLPTHHDYLQRPGPNSNKEEASTMADGAPAANGSGMNIEIPQQFRQQFMW
jgi:hypothetical protein